MRRPITAMFSPCRIGWVLLTGALLAYGLVSGQWTVLLAALAPAIGTLAGLLVSRRNGSCRVPIASDCESVAHE
ncbi:MAG: hypothetical protein RMK01_01460 [Thermomicrobium sp.]|nr:hypothetical protein [Thermomicrobium sp.]MDW8058722.1 hypothetical protein [Thermomicrobium sp.]